MPRLKKYVYVVCSDWGLDGIRIKAIFDKKEHAVAYQQLEKESPEGYDDIVVRKWLLHCEKLNHLIYEDDLVEAKEIEKLRK